MQLHTAIMSVLKGRSISAQTREFGLIPSPKVNWVCHLFVDTDFFPPYFFLWCVPQLNWASYDKEWRFTWDDLSFAQFHLQWITGEWGINNVAIFKNTLLKKILKLRVCVHIYNIKWQLAIALSKIVFFKSKESAETCNFARNEISLCPMMKKYKQQFHVHQFNFLLYFKTKIPYANMGYHFRRSHFFMSFSWQHFLQLP